MYRINTIEIRIPPLRERGNDLFLLADFFLQRYRKKYKKELRGISREARKMLQLYRWPGNVRELEHAIERAVILSTGTMLTPMISVTAATDLPILFLRKISIIWNEWKRMQSMR